ncbi:uncharacterized protein LOC126259847 [Schistocerca nitens]|uniref:uncharacterized protein LOC126259847 n=1 Tax=Schistocerca nitens TaxID=7011 RepID=UPI002118D57C|nr:uncharacterized protein LOC126259847 [Schistocerca nitens]
MGKSLGGGPKLCKKWCRHWQPPATQWLSSTNRGSPGCRRRPRQGRRAATWPAPRSGNPSAAAPATASTAAPSAICANCAATTAATLLITTLSGMEHVTNAHKHQYRYQLRDQNHMKNHRK